MNHASRSRVVSLQLLVAGGFMMEGIDGTMITTALPAIAADLKVSPMMMRAAISSYFIAMAVVVPISGWCVDRFGTRDTFCLAIVLFTLGSIGCAFAATFDGFIAARGLQGVGAALIFPVGRLVLLRTLAKKDLVQGMAVVAMPVQLGPIVGPIVGGSVTTYLHWGWLFWINVPLGVCGIVLTRRLLGKEPRTGRSDLDGKGFALVALGLGCLGAGLDSTAGPGWSIVLIGVGVLSLVAYGRHAKGCPAPLLDLTSLSNTVYRVCMVSGFAFRASTAAFGFMLPIMLQTRLGLSPMNSGFLTFFGAFGTISTRICIGAILRRYGFRRVLIFNAVACAVAAGLIAAVTAAMPQVFIVSVIVAVGFFCAIQIIGLDTLSYADLPETAVSGASTLMSVSKQFSPAIGMACAGLMLQCARLFHHGSPASLTDFRIVLLLVVTPLALTSLINMRFPRAVGSAISGHRAKRGNLR